MWWLIVITNSECLCHWMCVRVDAIAPSGGVGGKSVSVFFFGVQPRHRYSEYMSAHIHNVGNMWPTTQVLSCACTLFAMLHRIILHTWACSLWMTRKGESRVRNSRKSFRISNSQLDDVHVVYFFGLQCGFNEKRFSLAIIIRRGIADNNKKTNTQIWIKQSSASSSVLLLAALCDLFIPSKRIIASHTIWLTSAQSSRERSSSAMAKRYTTIDERTGDEDETDFFGSLFAQRKRNYTMRFFAGEHEKSAIRQNQQNDGYAISCIFYFI